MKKGSKAPVLFVLAIAIVCIGAVALHVNSSGIESEQIDWDLTLIGDTEMILSYDEIITMSSYEGQGGFFTTVGTINGPFDCKGIPIEDLCGLVGGINTSNTIWVSAPDGYLMVFTLDHIKGDFITYDPATMKEVQHEELKILLMYEQDGIMLNDEMGGPLRLAIAGSDALLTEGHYWVQSVERIEIREQNPR